jgi:hypothetical protein
LKWICLKIPTEVYEIIVSAAIIGLDEWFVRINLDGGDVGYVRCIAPDNISTATGPKG